jgi:hypothetical protein
MARGCALEKYFSANQPRGAGISAGPPEVGSQRKEAVYFQLADETNRFIAYHNMVFLAVRLLLFRNCSEILPHYRTEKVYSLRWRAFALEPKGNHFRARTQEPSPAVADVRMLSTMPSYIFTCESRGSKTH